MAGIRCQAQCRTSGRHQGLHLLAQEVGLLWLLLLVSVSLSLSALVLVLVLVLLWLLLLLLLLLRLLKFYAQEVGVIAGLLGQKRNYGPFAVAQALVKMVGICNDTSPSEMPGVISTFVSEVTLSIRDSGARLHDVCFLLIRIWADQIVALNGMPRSRVMRLRRACVSEELSRGLAKCWCDGTGGERWLVSNGGM